MIHHLIRMVLIGCIQIILSTGVAMATDHKIVEIIRNKVEQIRTTETLQIDDVQIASITVLPELYENNGFQRLWTNSQNVEDLFNAIRTIDEDGLHPDDYHITKIEQLRSRIDSGTSSDPALLADFDILLTDSLIRLGYHLIFIHDTPSKSLFERTDRTFSSGCIRTEKPFELAELLLDDPDKWNPESFKQAIDSGRTQTVMLPKPVPILLFYWTAAVEPDGTVRFKKDPYKKVLPLSKTGP